MLTPSYILSALKAYILHLISPLNKKNASRSHVKRPTCLQPTSIIYYIETTLRLLLFISFLVGEMELVRLVEHLSYLINLKEGSSARVAESEATTQIGNLVVKSDISLLS